MLPPPKWEEITDCLKMEIVQQIELHYYCHRADVYETFNFQPNQGEYMEKLFKQERERDEDEGRRIEEFLKTNSCSFSEKIESLLTGLSYDPSSTPDTRDQFKIACRFLYAYK